MSVATYPTSTFKLTQPIDLAELPTDGEQITVPATGELTLRGTTKTVTVDLAARRNGANIEVNGAIPIVFAEWGIPNPSFGPVTTEDHGELELLVVFGRA
jgi:polyisoprenoid-binding protein YceI